MKKTKATLEECKVIQVRKMRTREIKGKKENMENHIRWRTKIEERMMRWMRTGKVSEEKEIENKVRIRTMNKRIRYKWREKKSREKNKCDEGRSNVTRIMIKQAVNGRNKRVMCKRRISVNIKSLINRNRDR